MSVLVMKKVGRAKNGRFVSIREAERSYCSNLQFFNWKWFLNYHMVKGIFQLKIPIVEERVQAVADCRESGVAWKAQKKK